MPDQTMIERVTELRDHVIEMVAAAYRERIVTADQHGWRRVASTLRHQMMVDLDRACRPMNDIIADDLARQPIVMRIDAALEDGR